MEKTVLLVDDEKDILDILWIPLADMGFTVYTADNGEKALEIFKERKPPIVITDIKMPGMDGIQLLEMIKREDPDAEVIMITGHGDMNLAIKSLRDDATDFITKPINVMALQTAINRANERIIVKQKLKEYTEALEEHLFEKTELLKEAKSEIEEAEIRKGLPGDTQGLENLFDRLPCYISVVDRETRLISINKLFKEAFGGGPGDYCYKVLRQLDEPCSGCAAQRTFLDGKSYQYGMELADLSGQIVNVLSWTVPIRDEHGEITHVLVMSTNTSQIDELKDHLSSLGLMAGSMSHGIKALLTSLEGGVYMLGSGFSKDNREEIKEGYEVVKQMVGRMRNLILDILFYAKGGELKKEPVDVIEFANDVAMVVEPKMTNGKIRFVKDFNRSLSTFAVDAGMLSTALINVLENALDACVDDTAKDSHHILFSIRPEKEHVVFSIQDDGTGMDRETRENMFSLFFSAKEKKGTGLGLFITEKIIHQHGGIITVDSEKGKGTLIEIKVPIC